MKKIFIILIFVVMVGLFVLLQRKSSSVDLVRPTNSSRILPMGKLSSPGRLEPWQSERASQNPIPVNMQGVTDDPAVVELLRTAEKREIGKVVMTEKGTQQLWEEGKLLFEANRIGGRSKAADGTIALDAVTGNHTPIKDAEVVGTGDEVKLISSPREIWFVTPTGEKTQVSPPNIDAFAPVIAFDGKRIAFTGRLLNEKGFPSAEQLYVGDTATGQYQIFAGDEHLHDYQVWAVDWVRNYSVLRVLQDYGETGGHMKLMQVRFE